MKKGVAFALDIVTGVILTILAVVICAGINSKSVDSPVTMYEEPVPFSTASSFKVFQVFDGGALANCNSEGVFGDVYIGMVVCIKADGKNTFYDDQIISVPDGKNAMQIGTFRYQTRNNVEKVVPLLVIP